MEPSDTVFKENKFDFTSSGKPKDLFRYACESATRLMPIDSNDCRQHDCEIQQRQREDRVTHAAGQGYLPGWRGEAVALCLKLTTAVCTICPEP